MTLFISKKRFFLQNLQITSDLHEIHFYDQKQRQQILGFFRVKKILLPLKPNFSRPDQRNSEPPKILKKGHQPEIKL